MKRYHVFRDGTCIGSAATREAALDMIRTNQAYETHYILRASFSIIYGEEEFIPYETKPAKRRTRKHV